MSEEAAPQIRPLWVIGGGITAILLGLCALVSVCSAGALIWFSTQSSSSSARQVTLTASQRQTEQAVVVVPTRATRTPQTDRANLPPSPSLIFLPTLITTNRSSPEQAVRTYYQLVSDQRLDESWLLLSDTFKQTFNCCAPNYNYAGYVDWWNSVNYVDFGTVSTVSQSEDRAVVYAEIYFVMNSGQRSGMDNNPYIQLVFDPVSANWRFEDKRAAP